MYIRNSKQVTMLKKILLVAVGIFGVSLQAQDKSFDLLQAESKTHILMDRVWSSSKITEQLPSVYTSTNFAQIYSEIQRADFDQRFPNVSIFDIQKSIALSKHEIPLAVLATSFEFIPQANFASLQKNASGQWLASKDNPVFKTQQLECVAPLFGTSRTNTVTFTLPDNLVFSIAKTLESIQLQLENGSVYTLLRGQKTTVSFSRAGEQRVNVRSNFSDGTHAQSTFSIVTEGQLYGKVNGFTVVPNVVNSISSTLAFQGFSETAAYPGQGEYELYLDTTNGILDKPIILVDGFDPGDTRNTAAIYNQLVYGTGQNMADDLRQLGFDVIVLNFPNYVRPNTTTTIDGGVDFIQRNAYVLIELINQINAQKVGSQQNVVIGPSMGGLISRYALRYMEINGLNHDTRLYLSFDSPHLGANVPIGFQHLFNYMGFGPLNDLTMQALVNGMLKSPAARQMLIDHFEGHLQNNSPTEFNTTPASLLPTGAPNYRSAFQNELDTMGFPTTTRNIAIANGAGNGTMIGSPNMLVMNHTFNTSSTQRAIITLRFTPAANATNEVSRFKGQQWILFWITFYESFANSKAPAFTDGLDAAPGGRFDMTALSIGGGSNPLLVEFMANLQTQYFDFIPTRSSLSISNTNNLYAPVTASTSTPFAAYYVPTSNENHVTLTPGNMLFAYNEIVQTQLQNTTYNIENIQVKNPAEDYLEIYAPYAVPSANLTLSDATGKIIWETKVPNLIGPIAIPLDVQKGMYLLTLQNETGKKVFKLMKS